MALCSVKWLVYSEAIEIVNSVAIFFKYYILNQIIINCKQIMVASMTTESWNWTHKSKSHSHTGQWAPIPVHIFWEEVQTWLSLVIFISWMCFFSSNGIDLGRLFVSHLFHGISTRTWNYMCLRKSLVRNKNITVIAY